MKEVENVLSLSKKEQGLVYFFPDFFFFNAFKPGKRFPPNLTHQEPASDQTPLKRENTNTKILHVLTIFKIGLGFPRCVSTMLVVVEARRWLDYL